MNVTMNINNKSRQKHEVWQYTNSKFHYIAELSYIFQHNLVNIVI